MDLGIAGKVALVTASSKGLGRASAKALAAEGVRVVICARNEEALRQTESAIGAAGGEVHAVVADITDPTAPARMVRETVDRFGALDILVPNAGGPPPGGAFDITDEQIATAVNANATTSIRLVREAAPLMRASRWGRICCITSWSIKQPMRNLALSNVARTGLWAWVKTAAPELFPSGITLNVVCPGGHATDRMIQLGGGDARTAEGLGDPGDFGRIVAFLCSEAAGYLSGTAVMVDGAASVGLL
jgi:3-oxoacyl-[acyl-carrier protein] reductase